MKSNIGINQEGEFDEVPGPPDPVLEKIQNFILSKYEPCHDPGDADITMSTEEIYEAVMRFYPNELLFSKVTLVNWLHDKGFTFYDAGKMRFEWLLKSAS